MPEAETKLGRLATRMLWIYYEVGKPSLDKPRYKNLAAILDCQIEQAEAAHCELVEKGMISRGSQ